jgi:hypothetical protein
LILKEIEFGSKPLRWQKRTKEMARKEENNEKMKRRQEKTTTSPAEEIPVLAEGT